MHKLPMVVIIGRTNVGKSTLFNRLSTEIKSLTLDYEGVTRDFLSDIVCWQSSCFNLVDSGGITFKKIHDQLAQQVHELGMKLLQQADLILFVCDATVGPLDEDRAIANHIRSLHKPVVVALNKMDVQAAQEEQYGFEKLGFKYQYGVSAQHGTGIGDLLSGIVSLLPTQIQKVQEPEQIKTSVVLIGKPNVGKSSLMNTVLTQERMLVSEIPGTTREAISAPIRFYQETILLTDTPGIRRKRSVEEPIEKLMVKSSLRAIKNADIVLLMIDGSTGTITDQELKLAFYAFEAGKALIILVNKVDLMNEEMHISFNEQRMLHRNLFDKIPVLFISCKSRKNIGKIVPLIAEVFARYHTQFDDQELTALCKEWFSKTPLYHATERLLVKSVSQVSTAPITLLLLVNNPDWFGQSQLAFFENKLRKKFNLRGVPVIFLVRKVRD